MQEVGLILQCVQSQVTNVWLRLTWVEYLHLSASMTFGGDHVNLAYSITQESNLLDALIIGGLIV